MQKLWDDDAKALDVLQGETNVQMGWLVPTITLLKAKLQHLHISSKYCGPLIDALLAGLEKRFGQILSEQEQQFWSPNSRRAGPVMNAP